MLTLGPEEYYGMSQSEEQPCYTDLQPVIDLGYLVTSSTDPRLPEIAEEDSVCVEFIIQTDNKLTALQDCSVYTLPESPESLIIDDEGEVVTDLLQTSLYEDTPAYYDDDDDASVMLDLMDLSFLDEEEEVDSSCSQEGHEGRAGHRGQTPGHAGHCFTDTLDNCATVTVTTDGNTPNFERFSPSPSPLTPAPSPSPPPTAPQSPPSPATNTVINSTTTTTTTLNSPSVTTFTFHYCDLPATIMVKDTASQSLTLSLPNSALGDEVSRQEGETMGERRKEEEDMDFESFDNSDGDDDDQKDYKPYCDSRRGAKKNLLWKFLLWTLDHHPDVVSWTDVKKGVFKFVDTTRISTLWGQRKKKNDMTFEKLSRGIRHYYKRGLMERLSHTRLMYKFNWDKVPKRYRKA